MKAIIIAGGKGTRMQPLTDDRPKQLVELKSRPLLDHLLEALPDEISELIMVVGYRGSQIKVQYGDSYKDKAITYVTQQEQKGTWHALSLCSPYIRQDERFFVIYADDIHGKEGLSRCVAAAKSGSTMLVAEVEDPRKFGVVETDAAGNIVHIEEKPEHPRSNLVSSGAFVLTPDVFRYRPSLYKGEEYLPVSIAAMVADGHVFSTARSSFWFPIGYPEDIKKAEELFREDGSLST